MTEEHWPGLAYAGPVPSHSSSRHGPGGGTPPLVSHWADQAGPGGQGVELVREGGGGVREVDCRHLVGLLVRYQIN